MDIKTLTDEQKSVMLAQAMGIHVEADYIYVQYWGIEEGLYDDYEYPPSELTGIYTIGGWDRKYGVYLRSFYDPANMPMAWRVLNWANNTAFGTGKLDGYPWWHNFVADMRLLPPAAAQRAWLDKILELAIEAGLIEAKP